MFFAGFERGFSQKWTTRTAEGIAKIALPTVRAGNCSALWLYIRSPVPCHLRSVYFRTSAGTIVAGFPARTVVVFCRRLGTHCGWWCEHIIVQQAVLVDHVGIVVVATVQSKVSEIHGNHVCLLSQGSGSDFWNHLRFRSRHHSTSIGFSAFAGADQSGQQKRSIDGLQVDFPILRSPNLNGNNACRGKKRGPSGQLHRIVHTSEFRTIHNQI
mmetsp:Transcript_27691/g.75482  ORF Transcript_27691/g.75482 Transcript_27691/m.75482 type:complete len:213 (+) Transcript_27691:1646-2284(+)